MEQRVNEGHPADEPGRAGTGPAEPVGPADRQADGPEPAPDPAPGLRWEIFAFLELCAVCGLAVAQPLLDVIGRSPDFLLFHRAGLGETLLLLAAVVLVPPLVLWGMGAALRWVGPRTRRAAHAVSLGAAFAVFAVQVGKHLTPLRGVVLAVLALLAGVVAAAVCSRLAVLGRVLRVAAAGPLVFVLLFVFGSPASAVVLGGRAPTAAVAATQTGPHPPIVVIILDEFPLTSLVDETGRIDARRAPNFARLADGSTWYRNATTVSNQTTYAVPAMLTGRYPGPAVAPHYSRYPENLFTLFGGAYDIQAWESITQLCPPELCRGRPDQARGGLPALVSESASLFGDIASPYDSTDDPTAGFREQTVADDGVTGDRPVETGPRFRMNRLRENQPARFAAFKESLAQAGADTAPTLRFLHLLIPHSPWNYLASGTRYGWPSGLPFEGRWWARISYQRHMQQASYADVLLGEALAELRRSGQYDDSLIVVTSDHGDSFSLGVSGRALDADHRAAAELAWVPMFVKEPGQRQGRVDDRNWEHVDLLPTVARHAGFALPWKVDGRAAGDPPRAADRKHFVADPGGPTTIETARHFPAVLRGPAARPVLPELPELALVGRAVSDFPVAAGGPPVRIDNRGKYVKVRPDSGTLPALVYGTVPESAAGAVPEDTPIAIALNGRVGAVALAADDKKGDRRIIGLVEDESLFVEGENRLELFVVSGGPGDWSLTRMDVG